MTSSTTGCYFLSGPENSYLLFYDKKAHKAVPLCNKPDCLHMYEPDPKKKADCNAFFGGLTDGNMISVGDLIFYDGYLYIFENICNNNTFGMILLQISSDGTQRKELCTFKSNVQEVMIYRGYLYFTTSDNGTIAGKEDSTSTKVQMLRVPLQDINQTPQVIYEFTGIYANVFHLIGYQNSIFFSRNNYSDSTMQKSNPSILSYDLDSGKVSTISSNAGQYAICGNNLVYCLFDQTKNIVNSYICKLDGTDAHLLENVVGKPYSDNSYIIGVNYEGPQNNQQKRYSESV